VATAPNAAQTCRLCGSSAWSIALRPKPFTLIRCRRCGLVRTEGGPASSGPDYDATYYSAHALADTIASLGNGRKGARARLMDFAYGVYLDRAGSSLRRLAALPVRNRLGGLPPRWLRGTDLLDVGSGDGDFLRRARAAGYRVVGQEINPDAVASAQAMGVDVRLGELADLGFPPGSFDAVRLWHVLEHVPEPLTTLQLAHRLLRPGGVLIIGVPDFDSPARRLFGRREPVPAAFLASPLGRHDLLEPRNSWNGLGASLARLPGARRRAGHHRAGR